MARPEFSSERPWTVDDEYEYHSEIRGFNLIFNTERPTVLRGGTYPWGLTIRPTTNESLPWLKSKDMHSLSIDRLLFAIGNLFNYPGIY